METQLKKLLQIGILVEDLEASVRHYEEEYGVGPWTISPLSTRQFPKMFVNGKQSDLDLKIAFCHCFGLEIELMEPVSDSVYSQWLEEHGPGLHHLAFVTRDPFKDVIAEHKRLTGRDPWIWTKDVGAPEGRNLEFAYLDMVKELGFFLEIYPEHVQNRNESNIGGLPFKKDE